MSVTSPFANLHNALIAQIITVNGIRYVDRDLGQLDNYELRPPVSWACVLIDLDQFVFSDNAGMNEQMAEGNIMLRLALVKYTDSNNLVPTNIRANGLKYYEVEDALVKALHNWAPQGFSRLSLRSITTEKRDDDILVRNLTFSVSFTYTSAKTTTTITPRPAVTVGRDLQ